MGGGSKLPISNDRQYFWEFDTAYTKRYAVFTGHRYCLYQAIRSIFGGSILLILSDTQYFRGTDTAYIMRYAVFSGG